MSWIAYCFKDEHNIYNIYNSALVKEIIRL